MSDATLFPTAIALLEERIRDLSSAAYADRSWDCDWKQVVALQAELELLRTMGRQGPCIHSLPALGPNQTLVVFLSYHLRQEAAEALRQSLRQVFGECKVAVFCDGMRLGVVTRDDGGVVPPPRYYAPPPPNEPPPPNQKISEFTQRPVGEAP
ncbi:MAG: hypothetical protein M5U20_08345 [Phycisphaerales bacterium]|nr:hypothetical protein [Phycisphaerales bacterium]